MKDNEEKKPEENKKEPEMEMIPLNKLGLNLPIYQEGHENLGFSFKDWDMDIEEKLAELQSRVQNTGEFVRQMMDLLLEDLYGKQWDTYKEAEQIMLLNNMHFPNMMYMYIALRVEELGHELNFDHINCPACKKAIKNYVADLRTLEIGVKKKGVPQTFEYDLKKPIILEDGRIISQLKINVAQWGALESVPTEDAANGASVKKAIFRSAIQGALHEGEPVEGLVDLPTVVRKLKKFDIEKLQKDISVNNAGPEMVVGGTCPHCKGEFIKPLEWGYETFFDSSSL